MSQATFTITYAGPAVEGGQMDVRDLSKTLAASANLFTEANLFLNRNQATVNVNITAKRSGSFEITLQLIQQISSGAIDILVSDPINAFVNASVLAQLIFGPQGLIGYFKTTQGQPLPQGQIRATIEGSSHDAAEFIAKTVQKLSQHRPIQRSVDDLITPLEKEGIAEFRSTYNGHTETVTEDEAAFFRVPDQVVNEDETTRWYTIISPSFKEKRKWHLDDGSAIIPAKIEDHGFLRRVEDQEAQFLNEDRLKCTIRTRQTEGRKRLKTEHTVVEVH